MARGRTIEVGGELKAVSFAAAFDQACTQLRAGQASNKTAKNNSKRRRKKDRRR